MCGRYRLSRRKQIIEEHFDSISGEEDWVRRYNNAPTQPVPITGQNPKEPVRRLSLVRWGLIPSWAKDLSGPAMMINARSGTAATKPVFRDALKSRRFLVLADGFYEWRRTGKTKQPFCFEVNDGSLFAFAGLWDRWKDPNGTWVKSCSILTKSDIEFRIARRLAKEEKDRESPKWGRWSSPLERQGDYTDMFSIYESAGVTG